MDPDWLYPDSDPDPQNLINPDPGRIQVNKITKFSKHLLIFKSKKIGMSSVRGWASANISSYFFLGSDMRKKKYFCWLNSAFSFILSVILHLWIQIRIRNPDPDARTRMNPDPHHWFEEYYLFFNLKVFLSIKGRNFWIRSICSTTLEVNVSSTSS